MAHGPGPAAAPAGTERFTSLSLFVSVSCSRAALHLQPEGHRVESPTAVVAPQPSRSLASQTNRPGVQRVTSKN